MIELKIEQQGEAVKVELTEELLALLGAKAGDTLVIDGEAGGPFTLAARSTNERFERGRAFLERYRSTFEALAK